MSYEVQATFGLPETTVSAGNESLRKEYPGSGLGRSAKPAGLIVCGVFQLVPSQWASLIWPVEPLLGHSSHAIQNPLPPSEASEEPCE